MIKLNIKKDRRAKGLYYHKSGGFDCMKAKDVAMKDITNAGEGNYVYIEYAILIMCRNMRYGIFN